MLKFAEGLHSTDVAHIQALIQHFPLIKDHHSLQYKMQQMRIEKMVRSCLIVTVVELLDGLNMESPL